MLFFPTNFFHSVKYLFCQFFFVQGVNYSCFEHCFQLCSYSSNLCIKLSKLRKNKQKIIGEVCLTSKLGFCKFQTNCKRIQSTKACENYSEWKVIKQCQKGTKKMQKIYISQKGQLLSSGSQWFCLVDLTNLDWFGGGKVWMEGTSFWW